MSKIKQEFTYCRKHDLADDSSRCNDCKVTMGIKDYIYEINKDKIVFETADDLDNYVTACIAEFVRDNMFELNNHPMDYQDHYDHIVDTYQAWQKQQYNQANRS